MHSKRPRKVNCNKPWRLEKEKRNRDLEPVRAESKWKPGESSKSEKAKQENDRPPPGLRGKALGLWYRDRQRSRENQEDPLLEVFLPRNLQTELEDFVDSVKVPVAGICIKQKKENFVRENAVRPVTGLYKKHDKVDLDYLNAAEMQIFADVSIKQEQEDFGHINAGSFKKNFLEKITTSFEENVEKFTASKMEQDHTLDLTVYNELHKRSESAKFKKMFEFRQTLPTYAKLNEVLSVIERNQIVVISGGTGCGKTTQVAQYILDRHITSKEGSLCNIVCTQPRRISAVTVAERVAAERCERIGESVGYQIRLEKVLPARDKATITFATTGVVVQWMQSNPTLNGISHLIIDEIHERSTISDFLITLVKYIVSKRSDLKIILMSATLNADHFSQYFGGVPHIEIPGKTYPVERFYLEDVLKMTKYRFLDQRRRFQDKKKENFFNSCILPYIRNLEADGRYPRSVVDQLKKPESEAMDIRLIATIIQHICFNEGEGAILVFVPGLVQIRDLHSQLLRNNYFSSGRVRIIPLHSIMPTTQQREVFDPPPRGVRKIIIATNIAETSITIDDVVYVVDSGRMKLTNFDTKINVSTLEPDWESLANATQRMGRAGRVQSGKCYKLFTRAREEYFEPYPLPEIQRSRLEEVILQAKMLQLGKVAPFLEKVLDPPDPKAVQISLEVLRNLNALDGQERLTPLGYHLAKLPMDPQAGKMILMAALFSCVDPIFSIAASLSFKDPFYVPLGREAEVDKIKENFACGERSDHLIVSKAIELWEIEQECGGGHNFARSNFLSHHNLRLLRDMKKQFAEHLCEMQYLTSNDPKHPASNVNSSNISLVKAIICAGLYPNVARIKKVIFKGKNAVKLKTSSHPTVELHPGSYCSKVAQFQFPIMVYYKMQKSSCIYLHDVTMVHPMALLFFGERLDIIEEGGGEHSIRVDKMLKFKCFKRTGRLVEKFRNHLNWILEDSISNPGVIDWEMSSYKTEIMKAIVTLLTAGDQSTHSSAASSRSVLSSQR